MKYLALLCLATTATAAPGVKDTWAVIAAGSRGFMNYRHQADACHAYQVLRKSGIPAEQIILMMEDDVASFVMNPFPGKLFNKNGTDVSDVYAGCNIDYRGSVVTAELFLKVITGDTSAGGKVLKSTSSDRVFLNFVDHGGVGIIAFPNGPTLHVTDLEKALATMKTKNMFSELLFYMEACESGSMFPKLTADGKIFAVTAANGKESSWGWYCPPFDKVNGKGMQTCLGDLFSISWLEDADKGQFANELIGTQVARVKNRTYKSHVSTFGDSSIESEPFGNFVLSDLASSNEEAYVEERVHNAIDVRDIPMNTAKYRAMTAETSSEKANAWAYYHEIMSGRAADDAVFGKIVHGACASALSKPLEDACIAKMNGPALDVESDATMACHKVLTSTVFESCPVRTRHSPGGWNAYNMKYSKQLANMCSNVESLHKNVGELDKLVRKQCAPVAQEVVV